MPPRLIHGVKTLVPDLVVRSSKGSHVTTECGKTFLDLTTGIGVTNLGHCHPRVTAAVQKAVGEVVHQQQNIMRHRGMLTLIDRLGNLPFSKAAGLDAWFFWNSGAEAVEASIKLARQVTGKQYIVTVNGSYHGRTFGTMPLTTSNTIYRNGFGPLMGGVVNVPFPHVTRGPYGIFDYKDWPKQSFSPESYQFWGAAPAEVARKDTARCLDALELALRTQCHPAETAAVLLEPVLGEGGYVPCPPGYLKGVREICDRYMRCLIICRL
jgi:4-aminobutyrate aminotransferase